MIKKTTYGVMDTKVFEQVTGILNNGANEQDLLELNKWIIARLKWVRNVKANDLKRVLSAGMIVEWNGRKGYQKGTIVKVNRTRVQVKVSDGFGYDMTWNVPMSLVKIV